jgi:hypothetical protein
MRGTGEAADDRPNPHVRRTEMLTTQPPAEFLFRRKDHTTGHVRDRGLVFFPDIDKALAALEGIAHTEDWGTNRSVLHNYLNHTVRQLLREQKVIEATSQNGPPVAAFNTGLLTPDTQPIYGYLTQNYIDVDDAQAWYFGRWALSSDVVMRPFTQAPERARYWKESPGELLFHPDWAVEVRLEHIVDDDVERFPRLLQKLPHLRKHALHGAIDDALRQIEADPHLAVPGYHFDTGSVSLLLPLRLIHSNVVDLALVVGPFGDSRYAAWTVYPLDWAYRSARLIKAPSADWLGSRDLTPSTPELQMLRMARTKARDGHRWTRSGAASRVPDMWDPIRPELIPEPEEPCEHLRQCPGRIRRWWASVRYWRVTGEFHWPAPREGRVDRLLTAAAERYLAKRRPTDHE